MASLSPIFYDHDEIITVIISEGFDHISTDTFYDCNNLISVTIPDSVTRIGEDAFIGCDSLTIFYNGQSYSSTNDDSLSFDDLYALFN